MNLLKRCAYDGALLTLFFFARSASALQVDCGSDRYYEGAPIACTVHRDSVYETAAVVRWSVLDQELRHERIIFGSKASIPISFRAPSGVRVVTPLTLSICPESKDAVAQRVECKIFPKDKTYYVAPGEFAASRIGISDANGFLRDELDALGIDYKTVATEDQWALRRFDLFLIGSEADRNLKTDPQERWNLVHQIRSALHGENDAKDLDAAPSNL